MSDLESLSFVNQCRQAQKSFQDEVLFAWTKEDIMSQPDTQKNKLVKELIRRNEELEKRLQSEREEHQRVLSEIQSLSSCRGKFG